MPDLKPATATRISEGQPAPPFDLQTDGGKRASLNALKGKKIVLYFYPRDDTPGCTVEAQDFARMHGDFTKAGAAVLGISKDSVKSHDKFKAKFCLPFPLLSDEDGAVCEAYGVWVEKSMYGKKYMGIDRSTFLIDPEGKIARVWNKVKVDGHADEVLKAVKAL